MGPDRDWEPVVRGRGVWWSGSRIMDGFMDELWMNYVLLCFELCFFMDELWLNQLIWFK